MAFRAYHDLMSAFLLSIIEMLPRELRGLLIRVRF